MFGLLVGCNPERKPRQTAVQEALRHCLREVDVDNEPTRALAKDRLDLCIGELYSSNPRRFMPADEPPKPGQVDAEVCTKRAEQVVEQIEQININRRQKLHLAREHRNSAFFHCMWRSESDLDLKKEWLCHRICNGFSIHAVFRSRRRSAVAF